MRIGVIGTGRIGAVHTTALLALDEVEEVVLLDTLPAAARRLAQRRGCRVAADLDALLAGVDGVVIATPTDTHAPLLRRAIEAGRPAFCEKPVAATVEQTAALAALARDRGVRVQVGFQRRFDPAYLAAREAVVSGELGFVHSVRVMTHDQMPPPAAYVTTSGGIFRDCAVHDFDAVRFVTGREVVSVFATGANKGDRMFARARDVDTGAALLRLDDDTLVTATAARYNGAGYDVRLEVLAERGSVGVGYDQSLAIRSLEPGAGYPAGPVRRTFLERFEAAYRAQMAGFCRVVAGEPSRCTVGEAQQALAVAEACQRSLDEGRVVRLDELVEPAA